MDKKIVCPHCGVEWEDDGSYGDRYVHDWFGEFFHEQYELKCYACGKEFYHTVTYKITEIKDVKNPIL